jgi:hypothetical protein
MMVRPDDVSASNAPSTSPLKHCEMKLAQLIIDPAIRDDAARFRAAGKTLHHWRV